MPPISLSQECGRHSLLWLILPNVWQTQTESIFYFNDRGTACEPTLNLNDVWIRIIFGVDAKVLTHEIFLVKKELKLAFWDLDSLKNLIWQLEKKRKTIFEHYGFGITMPTFGNANEPKGQWVKSPTSQKPNSEKIDDLSLFLIRKLRRLVKLFSDCLSTGWPFDFLAFRTLAFWYRTTFWHYILTNQQSNYSTLHRTASWRKLERLIRRLENWRHGKPL